VFYDADDFIRTLFAISLGQCQPAAYRTASRKVLLHETLVHNGRMRAGEFFGTQRSIGRRRTGGRRRSERGAVFCAEIPPRDDWNTQSLKEARGDRVHVDDPAFALFIVIARDNYELVPTTSGQRDDARQSGRPHAGNSLDVLT